MLEKSFISYLGSRDRGFESRSPDQKNKEMVIPFPCSFFCVGSNLLTQIEAASFQYENWRSKIYILKKTRLYFTLMAIWTLYIPLTLGNFGMKYQYAIIYIQIFTIVLMINIRTFAHYFCKSVEEIMFRRISLISFFQFFLFINQSIYRSMLEHS